MNLFAKLCNINIIIDLISEIIIVLIIIFVFIKRIENNFQNILRLKKVFQI